MESFRFQKILGHGHWSDAGKKSFHTLGPGAWMRAEALCKGQHRGRRADPEGEDAVLEAVSMWRLGISEAGGLDIALSSGAAGGRSSGWTAGEQLASWDETTIRGHGVGGGRAEAGGEARANRIFSSKAAESVKKVWSPGEVSSEMGFKRAART